MDIFFFSICDEFSQDMAYKLMIYTYILSRKESGNATFCFMRTMQHWIDKLDLKTQSSAMFFFLQTTTIQITDNQGMRQSLRSLGFLFQKKFQFIFKIDFLLSEWRGQNGDKIIIISAGGGAEKQQQILSKSIGNKQCSLHSSKGGLHSRGVR